METAELKKFYKLALQGDKDKLVWKLGAAPNKSFDSMLQEIMIDSFYNFKEHSKVNADIAQKWGMLALKTVEKLEKFDKDTKDKKDVFKEISFQLNNSNIKPESKNDQPSSEGPIAKESKKINHISELN